MQNGFPTQAQVVIIGGGIVGCSLAYHLAELGCRDVVLLEQGRLSCGTTWHAAGLVGQLRSHPGITRLIRYSTELYASLEAKTGLATGWKRSGSITVARTADRMVQLRRTISAARAQGVEIELLSPREAGEKWPVMRTEDLAGAVWLPGDGRANPADITQALARGARNGGAHIIEQTRVTGIRLDAGGAASAVETSRGEIRCEKLAICAGQWSHAIGRMCGVTVPLHSAEHMYIVTERIQGVSPDLPVLRDPDGYIYFKEEVGGLVMGGFEPDAKPWGMAGIPPNFEFQLLPDDWDQFEILMTNALQRVPALETASVKTFVNGPESFTPDNNFLLGEAPERRGIFVGAGFNSAGIASAGGAGRMLAEWMLAGEPTEDLWPVDIRRFSRFHGNRTWLRDRVKETLGLHYAMAWPNRELASARPLRRSPLYDRLAAKGAVFGSKMGWDRPNWFAPAGEGHTEYSFGRQNWFPFVAEEHRAARERVALFDQTSFAKFLMQGADATAVLQTLCTNDVDVEPGRSVYTPMLNARGGFESDLTVARLARDNFLILTGTAQATRDADWITRHIPQAARAVLTDVSSAYAVIGVAGPRSRELLSRVSDAALGESEFPHAAIREIGIGYATALACRRSYAGGPGWELYVPTEFAVTVYETLAEAGAEFGVRDAGYYALEGLRIEAGFRAWGRELAPDVTPWEAGLGFAVDLHKPGGFIGRDALVAARKQPPARRLVAFASLSPDAPPAWGSELITADGEAVGEVTSSAYGHSVGGVVALGWVRSAGEGVDRAWLDRRRFALDIGGELVSVRASLKPFYGAAPAKQRALA